MELLDKLIAAGEDHQKAPQPAVAVPPLRPYLPGRRHARRVLRGLIVLARRAWRAARTALRRATAQTSKQQNGGTTGILDGLERAGVAVLVVVIGCAAAAGAAGPLWGQARPYARTGVGIVVAGLLIAAWIIGPDEPEKPAAGESAPAAGGEAPRPSPLPHTTAPLDAAEVAAVVRQLAVPHGWRGAHLDDVLAHLPGRSREDLLAVLADARIPVENQLKLSLPGGRQRNRQGIRLSTLPAAPGEPAPTPPPPAAQTTPETVPDRTPPLPPVTVHGPE